METRPFGKTGMAFTRVGLGTWAMEKNETASVEALRRGLDLGANHIDTAEMYGSGEVERIVGKAVRGRREKVFLVSKVMPSNATFEGTLAACERSLKNLGTDHIDVYLLHWRERTPLEETFRAFDALRRQGKIRAYGVSNFSVKDMEETLRLAGNERIACDQVLFHLGERAVEHDLLPWCRERGIPLVAYSPLRQGKLAPGPRLQEVARARKATPYQVALSFLLAREGVFAIPKSSEAAHVEENLAAAELRLSAAELAAIDEESPARRRRGLPML